MPEEQWLIEQEYDHDIQVLIKGSFDAMVLKGGKSVKKFKGEMACINANRLALDLVMKEIYGTN